MSRPRCQTLAPFDRIVPVKCRPWLQSALFGADKLVNWVCELAKQCWSPPSHEHVTGCLCTNAQLWRGRSHAAKDGRGSVQRRAKVKRRERQMLVAGWTIVPRECHSTIVSCCVSIPLGSADSNHWTGRSLSCGVLVLRGGRMMESGPSWSYICQALTTTLVLEPPATHSS